MYSVSLFPVIHLTTFFKLFSRIRISFFWNFSKVWISQFETFPEFVLSAVKHVKPYSSTSKNKELYNLN